MSGKQVLLASTFGSLNRLETLGLVSVWLADPATQSEGKTRRYFAITLSGESALAEARATSPLLEGLLGGLA